MTSTLKRWLRPWVRPVREWRELQKRRAPMAINLAMSGGHVDAIVRNGDALVAVNGWCADIATFDRGLRLKVAGTDRPPSHVFRVPRPDVDGTVDRRRGFTGAVAEWVVEPLGESCDAVLLVEGRAAVTLSLPAGAAVPYSHLHLHAQVVGREGIYGFGPPSPVVSDEVLQLARTLPPPVLDFGCGAGALVRALRRRGIEAYGLELDADRIRDSLFDEVRPFVTLYDGALPSPFATRQFASVVCSEVLEHIPGPEAALAELVRLASTALMITVPDMSAIPRGFPHGVVPWHLLESTHVNFFTQHSLLALLAPYTADVEVSRLGLVQCDRLSFYDTLATVARLDGKRADHAMGA